MAEFDQLSTRASLNVNAQEFRPNQPSISVLGRQVSDGDSSVASKGSQKREETKKRDNKNKQKKIVDASEIFNFTYDRPVIQDSPTQQFRKTRKANSTFTKDQYILAK